MVAWIPYAYNHLQEKLDNRKASKYYHTVWHLLFWTGFFLQFTNLWPCGIFMIIVALKW